ncbi:putative CRISPR-associated protein [Saccharolobus islandicus]|uniref:CRISPR-associated protein, APE2256 family n=1 Tax=Saccharolobus islandicus (strain M.14.25 / Kamchatka \|nr:putative CRISPR-associated protein [Sulfolobus islandicus]ACP37684.1 CRISPR-associated protein, APE2256 family [Sulfolobus islandicus M.14.25]
MNVHLSAVGTSVLRNSSKDPKIKDRLSSLGLENWDSLSLDDKKQRIIVEYRNELLEYLKNYIRENGEKASAELSALLKAFRKFNHKPEDTKIFLYYTNSPNSELAGEAIRYYLNELGYKDVVLAEITKINSEANFYEGMVDLFDKVITKLIDWKNNGYEIFINTTSGFKSETIFISIAGLMLESTLYYLHESFNDIIILPSPPISIKPNYVKIIKRLKEEGYVVQLSSAEKILSSDIIRRLEELAIIERREGAIILRDWSKKFIDNFYKKTDISKGYKIVTEDGKEIVVANGEELDKELRKLEGKKYRIEPLGNIRVR